MSKEKKGFEGKLEEILEEHYVYLYKYNTSLSKKNKDKNEINSSFFSAIRSLVRELIGEDQWEVLIPTQKAMLFNETVKIRNELRAELRKKVGGE